VVPVPVPQPGNLAQRLPVGRVLRAAHHRHLPRRRGRGGVGLPARSGRRGGGRLTGMLDRLLAAAGTLAVLAALTAIWAARLTIPYDVYVSELGADGMPTAAVFETALLLLVAGGFL